MGGILGSPRPPTRALLEFGEASSSPSDPVAAAAAETLESGAAVLRALEEFEDGNKRSIGASLAAPSDAAKQEAALRAVIPNVRRIALFYNHSHQLAEFVASAVDELGSVEGLRAQPRAGAALARALATAIAFDIGKTYQAAIVNDFSFYRRVLAKVDERPDLPLPRKQADSVSMFLAGQTPMMWGVREALAKGGNEATLSILAELAHAACAMIMQQVMEPTGEDGVMCARAMVACIWLVDHLAPAGAFARGSAVQARLCLKQLRVAGDAAKSLRRFLLHSSRTAQDGATPDSILRELRR